ncbi:MAG: type I-U CRISPR-associated helicase/endonuclease Cas3 [Gammaproteobacteria bacterium]|nr:type I-U CRISPR-associated helicase/endonuclease Cas3 [Gammaproteobacteria bacterium]
MDLTLSEKFDAWFYPLFGKEPMHWQRRLFHQLVDDGVPPYLDMPTGLGKTSVMAIWLIARVFNSALPRRLVYVVDRRAVVDQATREAEKLKNSLKNQDALDEICQRLGLAEKVLPVSTLRGQLADNREWLSDPTSPAIVVGTIDMIGSRLLFEGYGVSRNMRSFYAGLLGVDTLVVLDEAHLCPPFEALLSSIANDKTFHQLAGVTQNPVPGFMLLPLSATSQNHQENAFRLEAEDSKDKMVKNRLKAEKKLTIYKLDSDVKLFEALVDKATALAGDNNRVLVYCDSRKEALKVQDGIEKQVKRARINLLTGARRVRERMALSQWLEEHGFIKIDKDIKLKVPAFLVATSAGEVGIDLNADHMVCDLVSFERMVQRLGRVNRYGEGSAIIEVVAIPPKASNARAQQSAANYKARLAMLEELSLLGGTGYSAAPAEFEKLKQRVPQEPLLLEKIRAASTPEPLRPALTRALLDAWSMTSLAEHTGRPDVEPWLRGWVGNDEPQTSAAWREYLPWPDDATKPNANEVKAFFEAAPIHLTEILETNVNELVDILIKRATETLKNFDGSADRNSPACIVLNRAGELQNSFTVEQLKDLGAKSAKRDKERFYSQIRGCQVVVARLLGGINKDGLLDANAGYEGLKTLDSGWDNDVVDAIGYQVYKNPNAIEKNWKTNYTLNLPEKNNNEDPVSQLVVVALRCKGGSRMGDQAIARVCQTLDEHRQQVASAAEHIAQRLGLNENYRKMLVAAARLHDAGKEREMWQNAMCAPREGRPYAKTQGGGNGRFLHGYRHEFGSLNDAENSDELRGLPEDLHELALHLIASHHGYSRPEIAAIDPLYPPSLLKNRAQAVALRYARLQRRWGPWGLAWWEVIFRAADWQASKLPDIDMQTEVA